MYSFCSVERTTQESRGFSHERFKIGSAELDIDGILPDGSTEAVFRKGAWAFDI
ncbi:aminopeptidase [Amphibacillus xylanus]|uniref:Uncharacterized protein n=1 Tax=Amphibacillus xylanus (strain ATCC 51415 / DSM 6626 / JCM 7361 / LMG 17667 / NBRC 15112 / Ep01) TaxID=698758 RepID=K0J2Z3_AMPXN|nr:hypothetical protein AXY_08290 [Amphibacillus xylanus NBRC 15112]